jgi:eukaryotic-like serine/threonine-protein kinase
VVFQVCRIDSTWWGVTIVGDEDRRIAARYRLIERIGVGSMGVVWRGCDETLRRPVAVKQLLTYASSGSTDDMCERARREARVAARLHHPNAVTVYDVVEEDGLPWLIMEYVPADSVATLLARRGPLPVPDVAWIGAQIASALSAAHEVGVVHRDVKPGNVLLTDNGTAKLVDFGISRAVGDVVVTATGLVFGTPAYLAPEVANGAVPTPASDVFALGATLYAAVEGQPPFGLGDNPLALLHAVAGGRIRPPTQAGPLADVLESLLRTDPAERPTCAQAAATLATVAAFAEPAVSVPPVQVDAETERVVVAKVHKGPPTPFRTIILTVLAGAVAVAAVVTGSTAMTGGQGNAAPAAIAPAPHSVRAAPSTTPTVTPAASDPAQFITRYYALLPDHLDAAWQLLDVSYRAKVGGFGSFQGFYATIASVRVSAVTVDTSRTTTATLVFTRKDGTTSVEVYRFTIRPRGTSFVIEDAKALSGAELR